MFAPQKKKSRVNLEEALAKSHVSKWFKQRKNGYKSRKQLRREKYEELMEKWNKEKKEKNQIASSPFNLTILEAKGRILADEEEDARDSAEQQELVSYLI